MAAEYLPFKKDEEWDEIRSVRVHNTAVRHVLRIRTEHVGSRGTSSVGTINVSDVGRFYVLDNYPSGSSFDVIADESPFEKSMQAKARRLGVLEIQTRVEVLEHMARAKDHEAAHAQEDGIWFDVLTAIAAGHKKPAALAREALKTKDVEFDADESPFEKIMQAKARRLGVLEIQARVEVLGHMARAKDHEAAHAQEEGIWGDVLEAIAAGHKKPAALAREALKTKDVEFDRWGAR